MKAIIMEINKKHCVVMTEDGQFLNNRIPDGFIEIGDEIIIEEKRNKFSYSNYGTTWIRGFAIGFAVLVVLVMGSIFSYRFLKQYFPINQSQTVAAAKVLESELASEKDESIAQSPLFEKVLLLKKFNVLTEENINGILFSYQILNTEQEILQIKIENKNDSLKFEGSILLEMTLEDGSIKSQTMIELPGFIPGKIREEEIAIENTITNFKLIVYGSFN